MENEKLNEWTNGKFIARTAGTAFQYLHDINIQIYRPLLTKKIIPFILLLGTIHDCGAKRTPASFSLVTSPKEGLMMMNNDKLFFSGMAD